MFTQILKMNHNLSTATNMGLSAMMAEEYVLIDISLISCGSG